MLDDPQILARIAGHIERAAAKLYHAISIGDGAGFFRPGGRRQHHIGKVGGFGQENILHHQHLELGQTAACMVGVRIGHRRVFTHHVHALDLAVVSGIHDFNHGETGLGIELGVPEFLETRMCLGIIDALVIREHHRDQAGIGCALHIVLAAQRMQAGAGLADLAGHQGQRD